MEAVVLDFRALQRKGIQNNIVSICEARAEDSCAVSRIRGQQTPHSLHIARRRRGRFTGWHLLNVYYRHVDDSFRGFNET